MSGETDRQKRKERKKGKKERKERKKERKERNLFLQISKSDRGERIWSMHVLCKYERTSRTIYVGQVDCLLVLLAYSRSGGNTVRTLDTPSIPEVSRCYYCIQIDL